MDARALAAGAGKADATNAPPVAITVPAAAAGEGKADATNAPPVAITVPAAAAGEGKDGMVILDFREGASCVVKAEVLARHGRNVVFVPAPRGCA